MKKERDGEYDDNTNAKNLRASNFQKMEGRIVKFITAREILYVKDKLGLNWAYMKERALEFTKSVDGEDGLKAPSWWAFNVLKRSVIVGVNAHGYAREKSDE